MSTLPLSHFYSPVLASKLFWMRTNRVLAWALIVSPPLQWLLHMRFMNGLVIDLVILLGHAALSLTLFGKPATKEREFSFGMHVMGFRQRGLSDRNRFLLTGYRIALAATAQTTIFALGGFPAFAVGLVLLYPLLRLPITLMQHIFGATVYAMRRWGLRDFAPVSAIVIVTGYVIVSFANLVR